jgi:hypothetical protein
MGNTAHRRPRGERRGRRRGCPAGAGQAKNAKRKRQVRQRQAAAAGPGAGWGGFFRPASNLIFNRVVKGQPADGSAGRVTWPWLALAAERGAALVLLAPGAIRDPGVWGVGGVSPLATTTPSAAPTTSCAVMAMAMGAKQGAKYWPPFAPWWAHHRS